MGTVSAEHTKVRLTDEHISFASSLISHQFLRISGLHTTLLLIRYYCFRAFKQYFEDTLNIWIVASNMLTNDFSTVNVYNSLFAELDEEF